ncbi:MAG: gliding motility-associated C-terminal domain-containing protein [Lewinellaceae bacterium]|nr:gliding motility-associated C-terminal domain-containing protein [Lewinellaceae bacterium]
MKQAYPRAFQLCIWLWLGFTGIALAGTPSRPFSRTVMQPMPGDTTIVDCQNAASGYAAWINSLRLQIEVPVVQNGGSVIIEPAPLEDYTFQGPCGDTIQHIFRILDGSSMEVSRDTFWFAAVDTVAPKFNSPLPDSINLNCFDAIPAANLVQLVECALDTLIFQELTEGSGNCPFARKIIRTWLARDLCGRETNYRQVIVVEDNIAPSFTFLPPNVNVSCTTDISVAALGAATATDNCSETVRITHNDLLVPSPIPGCQNTFNIQRTWQAEDQCGNVNVHVQFIQVFDNEPPSFTPPRDTVISCVFGDDPFYAGIPTDLTDNCATLTVDNYRFEDLLIANDCPNTYSVVRKWFVFDNCGNVDSSLQTIVVVDTVAPRLTQAPQDLILFCEAGIDADSLFYSWLDNRAGAQAQDDCTLTGSLRWELLNTGTTEAATFPTLLCPANDSIILERGIDILITDECNNQIKRTVFFRLIDAVAPVITSCPGDQVIASDPGLCAATFVLEPPLVEENCAMTLQGYSVSVVDTLQASFSPGQAGETPVDPLELILPINLPQPINAFGPATLEINLYNADAEQATEFLQIFGENNTLLGRTGRSATQCGNADTTLIISAAQLNAWAADGEIRIRLTPNGTGRFAVNPICNPASTVEARLSFEHKNLTGIRYGYVLNDGGLIELDSLYPVTVQLPVDTNYITYYVQDCAGNIDSCAYQVIVEDREAPTVVCPDDIDVVLGVGACSAEITLPLPVSAADNCGVLGMFRQSLPSNPADSWFRFNFDPNLNNYLAQEKSYRFSGVAAGLLDSALITLRFEGDFSSPNAILDILGDDNSLIFSTQVGDATCGQAGMLTRKIAAARFNTWAADGEVVIRVVPRNIPTPSGQPGEGINPCRTLTANGQVDSTSYAAIELGYGLIAPSFYTTGATTYPLTPMRAPAVAPTLSFDLGETQVFYIVEDASGNADTCSFTITVRDEEAPVARCQPTTVFINPSGLQPEFLNPMDINANSTDNCRIDTMFLSPNTFICSQAGTVANVTLTVRDVAGNESSCSTIVRIENQEPQPTANSGLCGSDTLYLFANPPAATGGIVFTYRWTGPNGFTSTLRNPIIPNISSRNAGSYTVEITGITSCKATGTVEVAIEDLPLTPAVVAANTYCENQSITLQSSVAPSGGSVIYRWYQGVPPNGTLIGQTIVPSFTLPAPPPVGNYSYYLTIESNGCVSRPAAPKNIRVVSKPVAIPQQAQITVCEGSAITLGTATTGEGITYQWSGPNGYSATTQFPPAIANATPANGGAYSLVVSSFGCPSAPAFVSATVLAKPARPEISNTGAVCEGGTITLRTNNTSATIYTWVSPDLREFPTNTNSFTLNNITNAQEGPWRVYVTAQNCNSDLSLPTNVVVNDIPRPIASAAPANVCEGTTLQLTVSPNLTNATYRWTGPNNYSAAGQTVNVPNVAPLNGGRYQVTLTSAEGCSGTAFTDVEVRRGVRILAVSNDGPSCLGGPTDIRLTASVFPSDDGSYRYRWTGPNGYLSTSRVGLIPNATQFNNGNYQLVVTNTEGCASVPGSTTVRVTDPPVTPNIPSLSEATPAPICSESTLTLCTNAYQGTNVVYNWITPSKNIIATTTPCLTINQVQADDGGTYSVFVTIDGCNSRESGELMVSVSPRPAITARSNSPVCEGTPIELRVNAVPGASYSWIGPNFTSTIANPTIPEADSVLHAGVYTVVATLNGCRSAVATTQVELLPAPPKPVILANTPLCISDPEARLRLTAQPSTTVANARYRWFGPTGLLGQTELPTLEITNFAAYGEGSFEFTAQAQLGTCFSPLSDPRPVTMNTVPEQKATAGADFAACEAPQIFLAAQEPALGTGRWSLVTVNPDQQVAIVNPSRANSAVTGMQGGQRYTFQWTLTNGACINYDADQVQVTVTRQDTVDAGTDILSCAARDIQLNARPPVDGQGRWTQSEVQQLLGISITDPSNPQTTITGMQPGNLYSFTWTISGACGEVSDDVFVVVSAPNPFAGPDQTVCNEEGFVQLNADAPNEGSKGRWTTTSSGISFTNPENPKATATGVMPGEHLFIWQVDGGVCGDNSRDTVRIFFKRSPLANPDSVNIGFNASVLVDVLANDFTPPNTTVSIIQQPLRGQLTDEGNGVFRYQPNSSFVGRDRFLYELCSTACECSVGEVTINVGDDSRCAVPSIITPNNDRVNDAFVIPCLLNEVAYPNSQVIIFNRWGDEVFRSQQPYRNNWDGTYDGEPLPVGTYFYLVNLGDGSSPLTGFLIIQR